jgi:hypothetical protein
MRSRSIRFLGALAAGTLGLASLQDAHAIITRHDVDDAEYVVEDSSYPALVDLFGPGDCIATVIHESTLLTVAHCAMDLRDSQTLTVNGISHAIAEVVLHPQWDGWLYDIALIRLVEPVEGVVPYPLYRGSNELGRKVTIVGRGVHATGLEGEPGATLDRKLRRATNLVSDVNGHWIEVTFEEPGEDDITDLEGVGAGGDSGGPAFIETDEGFYIAGLNSWGDADRGVRVGQYGAWDYSTRVSRHLEWLDSEVDTSVVRDTGDTGDPPDTGSANDTGGIGDTGGIDVPADSGDDLKGQGQAPDEGCGCTNTGQAGGWIGIWGLLVLWRRSTRLSHPWV